MGDLFATDIHYHDFCSKNYMNKYHAKIEEIMRNLEMEDSVSATNDSLKENLLALNLDFSKSESQSEGQAKAQIFSEL